MSRLVYSVMLAFSLSLLSISAVGCGGGGGENTVIEETRTPAEIQQELDDYDQQMEAQEEVTE